MQNFIYTNKVTGQKVVFTSGSYSHNELCLEVVRETATMIITKFHRFNKNTGQIVGDKWTRMWLTSSEKYHEGKKSEIRYANARMDAEISQLMKKVEELQAKQSENLSKIDLIESRQNDWGQTFKIEQNVA